MIAQTTIYMQDGIPDEQWISYNEWASGSLLASDGADTLVMKRLAVLLSYCAMRGALEIAKGLGLADKYPDLED